MPDDEQPDGQEPDSSGDSGGDLEQRVGRIEAAVAQLLAGRGESDPATPEPDEPPARRTIRDEESHVEHLVRQASAKIHGEEEAEARLAALEKKLEVAPAKVRRSTRLTWGEP